jgi:hypothetical protein
MISSVMGIGMMNMLMLRLKLMHRLHPIDWSMVDWKMDIIRYVIYCCCCCYYSIRFESKLPFFLPSYEAVASYCWLWEVDYYWWKSSCRLVSFCNDSWSWTKTNSNRGYTTYCLYCVTEGPLSSYKLFARTYGGKSDEDINRRNEHTVTKTQDGVLVWFHAWSFQE